jgi:hypothetical protein
MLYTSAATSLVQPQLRLSTWQHQDMAGVVRSQFANPEFIKQSCATPITANYDPKYAHDTCAQMEHAAMAYHNYYGYISAWTDFKAKNQSGDKLSNRPKGFALLNDNTTISAPWIEQQEVKTFNSTVPRYINNVTMAMPHIGVIQAAIDPKNALMQPIEADGSMYHIRAAVPSPFINVLCATLIEEDMKPFLINHTNKADPYATGSAVADVFGFGEKYGTMRLAPVFPRLPIDYNTLVNDTVGVPTWGRPTIFVLGKSGPQDTEGRNTSQYYSLCQLQVGTTPHCTTNYNASSTGATMDADCSDPDNRYAFSSSMQVNTTSGNATINRDWANIAGEWARSKYLPPVSIFRLDRVVLVISVNSHDGSPVLKMLTIRHYRSLDERWSIQRQFVQCSTVDPIYGNTASSQSQATIDGRGHRGIGGLHSFTICRRNAIRSELEFQFPYNFRSRGRPTTIQCHRPCSPIRKRRCLGSSKGMVLRATVSLCSQPHGFVLFRQPPTLVHGRHRAHESLPARNQQSSEPASR